MLRFFGILCVISACICMGFWKSFQVGRRMKELKTLQQIFMLLKGAIQFGGETLPEELENISQKVDEPFRSFLRNLAGQLKSFPGYTFAQVFEQGVCTDLAQCCLTKEDRLELIQAGEMIGYLDRNMQMKALDRYLDSLSVTMEDLHKVLPNQRKLYRTLGIMGGLLMGILLI